MTFHVIKPLSQIKDFLAGLADRADQSLCAEQDKRAHARGWTVTRTGFGARRYRDPRFDRLRASDESLDARREPVGPVRTTKGR
ncbi:hypothetical protein [Sphaerisporangium dianthi]|uniref:Uncharacterized protein n=1 Tax=Sphaerisporangium dianthi TaxID=1436120 RepID=A0ABV9C9M3_9ACTN